MGLDLALGGLLLLSAIRGWFKGFLAQAIRLGGLVAAAYVAAPVRDQAKPYALEYLPTIRPDLVDRLLWWGAVVVSYVVIVGVASLIVSASRRQPYGIAEPNRSDQFAGLGLGVLKGLIVASFLVAGLTNYGQPYLAKVDWVQGQTTESYAWDWNTRFRPAARIWTSPPVREFVTHVWKMGLSPAETETSDPKAEPKPVQTASRTPELTLPGNLGQAGSKVAADPELARLFEALEAEIQKLDHHE